MSDSEHELLVFVLMCENVPEQDFKSASMDSCCFPLCPVSYMYSIVQGSPVAVSIGTAEQKIHFLEKLDRNNSDLCCVRLSVQPQCESP